MSVFDSILGSLRRFGVRVKSSLIWNVGSIINYSTVDSNKAVKIGYQGNSAVYSITSKAAKKFASINREVFDKDGNPIDNDLSKLVNRPNEYEGQDAFLERLYTYKQLTGEAFIWLNRGDITDLEDAQADQLPILEMYVLPSNHVLLVPDENNVWGVIGYILDIGGQYVKLRKNDVIHWKNANLDFDPITRTHMRGISPLTPGYKTLQSNNDAIDAAVRMFQNDGAKGVLTNETLNDLTPIQESQLRSVIDAKINNKDVKGAVASLQGKWNYLSLAGSIDMQLLEARRLSYEELCYLFDIPYELFQSQTSYANKESAKRDWIIDSIVPASKQLDDELNRMLLKPFKLVSGEYIGHDYTGIVELQPDLGRMVTALASADWLTYNEKRAMMNKERMENPLCDELLVAQGKAPLSQLQDDGGNDILNQLQQLQLGGDLKPAPDGTATD